MASVAVQAQVLSVSQEELPMGMTTSPTSGAGGKVGVSIIPFESHERKKEIIQQQHKLHTNDDAVALTSTTAIVPTPSSTAAMLPTKLLLSTCRKFKEELHFQPETPLPAPQAPTPPTDSDSSTSSTSTTTTSENNNVNKSKSIQWESIVQGIEIPSHDEYPDNVRKLLWNSFEEIAINAQRNIIEFTADNWNWRTATEEDGMLTIHCCNSSQPQSSSLSNSNDDNNNNEKENNGLLLVHPASFQRQKRQQEKKHNSNRSHKKKKKKTTRGMRY